MSFAEEFEKHLNKKKKKNERTIASESFVEEFERYRNEGVSGRFYESNNKTTSSKDDIAPSRKDTASANDEVFSITEDTKETKKKSKETTKKSDELSKLSEGELTKRLDALYKEKNALDEWLKNPTYTELNSQDIRLENDIEAARRRYQQKEYKTQQLVLREVEYEIQDIEELLGKRSWFRKPEVGRDGYQNWGEVNKAILATGTNIGEKLGVGLSKIAEGTVDAVASSLPYLAQANNNPEGTGLSMLLYPEEYKHIEEVKKQGYEELKEDVSKFVAKDIINEEGFMKNIYTKPIENVTGVDVDANTVLGARSEGVVESVGQMGGTIVLQAAGVPWWVTSGATALGSQTEAALNEGANLDEAFGSGIISAGAEILFEKISGGIDFGSGTLDDLLLDPLLNKISNKVARTLVKLGVDAGGEGLEEVFSEAVSKLGTKLCKEENLQELLFSEQALDEYIESFIGGAFLGGGSSTVNAITTTISGGDYVAELSKEEKAVVDKVTDELVAEKESKGNKLSNKEKNEIRNSVIESMEKGDISTDVIESVLGGDNYTNYKGVMESESKKEAELQRTIEAFENLPDNSITVKQRERLNEARKQLEELKNNSQRGELKNILSDSVFGLVGDSRLAESYKERAKRGQQFTTNLNRYNEKYRGAIQKAMDSGVWNNTRRSHETIEMLAKISVDKGIDFEYLTNEKINETSFGVEGKIVNGYRDGNKIGLNIESPKYLNRVVGHEITHILEGTDFYNEFSKMIKTYAKNKGDYQSRIESLNKMYKGVKGYETDFYDKVDKELVADLVGDYIFTDSKFLERLSVENRNVFQKMYDEIKYLCRVATAGSKEARELERVKKEFERVYRGDVKKETKTKGQYSLMMVDDVQPSTEGWHRTLTTDEAKARFPKLWDVSAEDSDVRNPTQISSTVKSYRKVYDLLESEGFNGTILDASSGLGYGTKAGIEEYGFDVEDIEPYPDKNYSPKYKDYSTLNKKYDVVISNAVLNVLPQDQRDALVVKMGEMLNDGGRIFINVRGKDVDTLSSNPNNTKISPMEWFVDSTGSYQKGFTKRELVAYLQDALGDGFTVKPTNVFGAVSAIVTKDGGVQYSLSEEQQEYFKDSVVRDENGELKVMYHGTSKGGFNTFDTYGSKYGLFGTGSYFTDNKGVAESYTNKGKGDNKQVYETYLNITNPMDMDAQGDVNAWHKAFPDADFSNCSTNEDFYRAMEEYFEDEGYYRAEASDMAVEAIQSMGYDGITHIGGGRRNGTNSTSHRVYIAFESNQIKNIDNIKPTENPDIRYSLSEDSEGNKLTEKQEEHFKNSKAVDQNGNLLRVYHTTNNDFTVFDKSRKGEATEDANTYLGFFFADDKDYMQNFPEFKNGKTDSYYLNMTNPIDMTNISKEAFLDIVDVMGGDVQEAAEVFEDADSKQLGHLLDDLTGDFYYNDFIKELKPHYDELMSRGYDGVINFMDELFGAKEYVVLDSNQAKLTSNLNPTSDSDIRYSLSEIGETPTRYGNYNVSSEEVMYKPTDIAPARSDTTPIQEGVAEQILTQQKEALEKRMREVAKAGDVETLKQLSAEHEALLEKIEQENNIAPYGYTPMTEEEANALQGELLANIDESDMPPEVEAPYQDSVSKTVPDNPFEDRDIKEVGNRKIKAYMYENPEVKPFFQEEARNMLGELKRSTKGERWYNSTLYYETNGELGFGGTKRQTSADIAYLLDNFKYTYAEIEKGLNAIIEDNGAENNAVSKRIEFLLDERLRLGNEDETGFGLPPNQDYINLLNEKQITEYNDEAFESYVRSLGDNLPPEAMAQEEIAPAKSGTTDAKTESKRKTSNSDLKRYISKKPAKRLDGRVDATTQGAIISDGKQYMSHNGRFIVELNTPDETIPSNDTLNIGNIKKVLQMASENAIDGTYKIDAREISRIRKNVPKGDSKFNLVVVDDNSFDINYVDAVLKAIENPTISLSVLGGNHKSLVVKGSNGQALIAPVNVDSKNLEGVNFVYKAESDAGVSPVVAENIAPTTTEAISEDIAPTKDAEATKKVATVDDFRVFESQVYNSLAGKPSNKYYQVGNYGVYVGRNTQDQAIITIKKPNGEKVRYNIEGGKYWKNERLWHEAAERVAKLEYPDIEVPKHTGRVAKILPEGSSVQNKGFVQKFKDKISDIKTKTNDILILTADKGLAVENLGLKTKNEELYAKYKRIRDAEGIAQRFIGKGVKGIRALNDIRKAINGAGLSQEFKSYLYNLHNVDRMKYGKAVFGDDITAEMSQNEANRLEAAHPEFKQYAKELYDINNFLRKMMVDKGIISQKTADLWAKMYPHYMPIKRDGYDNLAVNVPLDSRKTGVNAPIKMAVGGNSDIHDVFETMGERIIQTFKAVAKNDFGLELMNTLNSEVAQEKSTLEQILDNFDNHEELLQKGKNGSKPTFTVFKDGKRVKFEINDELYKSLAPTNEQLAKTYAIFNKPSEFLKKGMTEYNLVFTGKNALKDLQDVLINSKHPAKTYGNIPEAAYSLLSKSGEFYDEFMENGGEQQTYFDKNANTFEKDKTLLRKIFGFPLDKISDLNNFVERLPRYAEYIASRKMGRSIELSMLDSARVTTDFSAGGDFTKFFNRNGCYFLNASVQGAMQQVRNVREAKAQGFKGWAKLAAKYVAAGLPAILLNHLFWDDDEEYEELSDYVKDNYYIVGKYGNGEFVRIPKGRALAVIQNGFKQMENLITGNEEVDFERFGELVVENLAPNNPLENNIFAPAVQAFVTNKTWYGDDLVPTRLQDVPEAEQYDETTDAISKWLGEKTNISPIKLNYVLNQYSGIVGDTLLPMFTPKAERGDDSFLGNVIAPFKDAFTTDSTLKNQSVSDFYTLSDELSKNANSSYATDEDVLRSKYINSVSAEMSELYKQKREIQNSSYLSDSRKYEEVKEIQKQINELAKNGVSTYEDVTISGSYGRVGDRHYHTNKEGEWEKITDKQLEKQEEVTNGLGISASKYWSNKEEYDYAYEYPEKYAVSKAVGGYKTFKKYSSELYDIKADKDSNGKSISGSRKNKVIDYINNSDLDYYARLILYKSEYNADDTYNNEIIDYLNGRDDLSYEDRINILKELGFTVYADGTVKW